MKRDETDLTLDEMLNHTLNIDNCLLKVSFIEYHGLLHDFNSATVSFVYLRQSSLRTMLKLTALTLLTFNGSDLL